MQAIVRVKRPLEDSPSETLILNCNKKRKLEEASGANEEPLLAVLKFTGTQNSQDEDITKHVSGLKSNLKEKLLANFKKHNIDIDQKLREEAKENSKNSRFKVINCLRSNVPTESHTENLPVYDLELDDSSQSSSEKKYVYDLYFTNTNVLDEIDHYNVSIYPTSENLVFDSDDVYCMDEEVDSDDSNAENNWRNDYPDESDSDSTADKELVKQINRILNIDSGDSLSSDEDPYDLGDEPSRRNIDFYNQRSGCSFARFKAQYMTYVDDNDSDSSDESSESNTSDDEISK